MSVDAKMLRELLAGANPLPWSVWCGDDGKPLDFGGLTVVRDAAGSVVAKFNREMAANLVFIRDANDRLACGAVNSLPVLLDELASLQSRLAAAESRAASATAEAERARGLLGECRTAIAASMLVVGTCDADRAAYCAQLLEAVDRARTLGLEACERIDAHLASRPEGEVRHG